MLRRQIALLRPGNLEQRTTRHCEVKSLESSTLGSIYPASHKRALHARILLYMLLLALSAGSTPVTY